MSDKTEDDTNLDKELEPKMLNLFRRMSVCAAHHQEKESEWIDGQCVTPSTATKEAIKLIEEHESALKQELNQSLEAEIEKINGLFYRDGTQHEAQAYVTKRLKELKEGNNHVS